MNFPSTQQSPQYKLVNQGDVAWMSFKYIFFLGVFTPGAWPDRGTGLPD